MSSISPTLVCVSLDEPKPVDSALTFPSGYDTLEYSWVKATAVSVRLRIYLWRYKVPTVALTPSLFGESLGGLIQKGQLRGI